MNEEQTYIFRLQTQEQRQCKGLILRWMNSKYRNFRSILNFQVYCYMVFTFCLFFGYCAQSQKIYYTYATSNARWSEYKQTWIWNKAREQVIRITIHNNIILVDDRASSTYRLERMSLNKEDNYTSQKGWDAIDENNLKCFIKVLINRRNDSIQLYVMYDDYAFVYYLDL